MRKTIIVGLLMLVLFASSVMAGADPRFGVFPVDSEECTVEELIPVNVVKLDNNDGASWCAPKWECSEWSECRSDGYVVRTCDDKWDCDDFSDLPHLFEECEYVGEVQELFVGPALLGGDDEIIIPMNPESDNLNAFTGAVTGGVPASKIFLALLGLLILGLYGLFVAARKKQRMDAQAN